MERDVCPGPCRPCSGFGDNKARPGWPWYGIMQSRDADKSAKAPSTVDRVAFLDQHLCQRLAEVEAAEARLAKRLEQVKAAEERLGNLQAALVQSNSAA